MSHDVTECWALHAGGVPLAVGSDCHDANYDCDFPAAADMLAAVGITDEGLWRLPPRPVEHS